MEVQFTKICENELDLFLNILREIAIWLRDSGKDMWSLAGLEREPFLKDNAGAEMYICRDHGEPVGAFMLKDENRFWWPEVTGDDTFFLKKFGVSEKYRGSGVSAQMINGIKAIAKERNKKFIRIEIYADRAYLAKFYMENGFKYVRNRIMPDGVEIAFYEYCVA